LYNFSRGSVVVEVMIDSETQFTHIIVTHQYIVYSLKLCLMQTFKRFSEKSINKIRIRALNDESIKQLLRRTYLKTSHRSNKSKRNIWLFFSSRRVLTHWRVWV